MSQSTDTESIFKSFDSILKTLDLKYKDKLAFQALAKEKKNEIIQFRENVQIKNDFKQYGSNPQEITEYFTEKMELNPQFEDIVAFYEWITYQISNNQKLIDLEESLGLETVISALMQYGSLKHDNAKKLFLLHILKILVVDYGNIFGEQVFLQQLSESDVIHSLPQWLETNQVEMVCLLLNLMNPIFWTSKEGLQLILDGFEIVQAKYNSASKFTILTNILSKNKSSILYFNICTFVNSFCAAYQNHFNNDEIIDEIETSGLIDLLCKDAFNQIKNGQFFIEDCSFSKEDYYGVTHSELFFVADYERRQNSAQQFFYKKETDFIEFQNLSIPLFIQSHQLQQKQTIEQTIVIIANISYFNNRSLERIRQREQDFKKLAEQFKQSSNLNKTPAIVLTTELQEDEDYIEKVKGGQKQIKLEEKFKNEVLMREKEKMEQSQRQVNDLQDARKSFGRQNGISAVGKEEKNQLWVAKQEIQKLEKEIEKLNSKVKQQDSQEQISQNVLLRQAQIQGQLLDKQITEEKDKQIQKMKQENIQLQARVIEIEQLKQKFQEELEQQKLAIHTQLQKENSAKDKSDELGERIKAIKNLNEQLSSATFKYEEYKQQKEKEITQLNMNISALKSKNSTSEENKNDVLTQNLLLNEKIQKLDAIFKQLDIKTNGGTASKESIVKLLESQFLQEITDLKQQNQTLQQQISSFKDNIRQSKIIIPSPSDKPQVNPNLPPQPPQITGFTLPPPAPPQLVGFEVPQSQTGHGIPQPPSLSGFGVPQALSIPGLSIPQAPSLSGIPTAPQLPGILQAPNINGIPSAPPLLGNGAPQAPSLQGFGIPQPPQLPGMGIPPPPPLLGMGIPPPPPFTGMGIPPPPPLPGMMGIPQPPPLSGMGIPPPPTLSGIGMPPPPPPFPGMGLPTAPSIPGFGGAPSAPSIPGFGAPSAPNILGLGIPSVPSMGMPGIPSMAPPMLPNMGGAQIQQGVKQKKNPGIPMKGVNWAVLKYADIQGTLWEKVKEEKIDLEEDYLKQEFCQKATIQKAANSSQSNNEAQVNILQFRKENEIFEKIKQKKVTFLSGERQQNVLLILGKVKLKGEQIAELLISCDQTKLTSNLVNSLLSSLPNEAEMSAVQAYDGKIENLADAEKYFKALEKVNGYEERLQALRFKNNYQETKEFLVSKTQLVSQLFDQLQTDNRMLIILENALAVGNFMNGTGFKGGAWGFKVSNIDKMTEVKSFDGKLNLLMYLINRVEKKEGKELVQIDEDLKILEECSKTPISQLISEITDLKRGVKYLEKAIKVQTSEQTDNIKNTVEPFYIVVQPEIQDLETKVRELETRYKTISEYYCEDPRKVPSDEFAKQFLLFKRVCIQAKIGFKNLKR